MAFILPINVKMRTINKHDKYNVRELSLISTLQITNAGNDIKHLECIKKIVDFLFTLKAATLISISGRGSAISSA